MMVPVITLDGVSGSGKSSLSLSLASVLGWHVLDSGALYRCVGLLLERAGITEKDPDLYAHCMACDIRFEMHDSAQQVWLNGEEVTQDIRQEHVGLAASRFARLPAVREALLPMQRRFARAPGLVAEGRDMGTVVFPEASVKFFLEADPMIRAQRRHLQLQVAGKEANIQQLAYDIAQRDAQDRLRERSPTIAAKGAIRIDSSALTQEESLEAPKHLSAYHA